MDTQFVPLRSSLTPLAKRRLCRSKPTRCTHKDGDVLRSPRAACALLPAAMLSRVAFGSRCDRYAFPCSSRGTRWQPSIAHCCCAFSCAQTRRSVASSPSSRRAASAVMLRSIVVAACALACISSVTAFIEVRTATLSVCSRSRRLQPAPLQLTPLLRLCSLPSPACSSIPPPATSSTARPVPLSCTMVSTSSTRPRLTCLVWTVRSIRRAV